MWRSRGQQARALGDFFRVEDTHFTAIYTSDLKRAVATAEAIRNSQGDPKPSSEPSKLLREQNFGDAEGNPKASEVDAALTLEELMEKRVYIVLRGYEEKFPNGESAKDLNGARRLLMQNSCFPMCSKLLKRERLAYILPSSATVYALAQ